MKIRIELSEASVDAAYRQVKDYADRLKDAGEKIAKALAEDGYAVAYQILAQHVFTGETISNLSVRENSPTSYTLYTASQAILFLEFGAGATYGYGHPNPGRFGPGTYPVDTAKHEPHWDDPNGWWYPKPFGEGYAHTYGNAPHMPFWQARTKMREDILKVAKEVLGVD